MLEQAQKEQTRQRQVTKAIGFKSVFGKSERVTIFSDGYQFRFDKAIHKSKLPWQIIPLWTEPNDLTKEIQDRIAKT